jgi:hypothetical protein
MSHIFFAANQCTLGFICDWSCFVEKPRFLGHLISRIQFQTKTETHQYQQEQMIHYCTYVIPYLAQLQEQCESWSPRMCRTLSLLKFFGGSQNTFRTHRDMQLTRIGFTSCLDGATTCGG